MRKDSQGLCFLGKIKYEEFVLHHLGSDPGDVVDIETNKIVGRHKGLWLHTIGQHRGIGNLLTMGRLSDKRWFTVAKDMASNILFVSANMNLVNVDKQVLTLDAINWISGIPVPLLEQGTCNVDVKLKHGPELYPGTLSVRSNSFKQSYDVSLEASPQQIAFPIQLMLHQPTRVVAEGQFAVFYRCYF